MCQEPGLPRVTDQLLLMLKYVISILRGKTIPVLFPCHSLMLCLAQQLAKQPLKSLGMLRVDQGALVAAPIQHRMCEAVPCAVT
jgi:hypothetical protein